MCGICGIVSLKKNMVDESSVRSMMKAMKHRGPDDEGLYSDHEICLGFVRLSIIDLSSAGHQPMHSYDKRYVVIFNGEIYNYVEIREELKSKGYTFRTNTDTEVLLDAYIEWGEDCLNHFNGMFALVIYDKLGRSVFAARDRFGIKPFYYYRDEEHFIFASEIPPILGAMKCQPKPNNQTIFDYLLFNRTDQTEETFFQGICKLQHGHKLTIDDGLLSIKKWYDLRSNLKEPFKSPDELRSLLSSSIRLRLRSDVPVGVCLSGGMDSSSIVSLLIRDMDRTDLNTFSAVYEKGQYGDESEYISTYADKLENMLYTRPTAESLFNDLHSFVRAHAEPMPSSSPYAQFKVMELAKKNVVVTLDGQGADEELGGYYYFYGLHFKELLLKGKLGSLFTAIVDYMKVHRSLFGIKAFLFFLLPEWLSIKAKVSDNGYLTGPFIKKHFRNNTVAGNLYASRSVNEALLDHFEYKLEHLLKWEDRNSMWFSLEARVPFLDYRLVERALSTPSGQLIHKGTSKYILRQAMKDILPEKIRMRVDKIGFATPEALWFREEYFRNFIHGILTSPSFKNRGIIDPEKALQLFEKHCENRIDISKDIWKWINLELWFRMFIDGNEPQPPSQ
jgi:asparagine synthase (glutamine-hydrolysing)